MEDSGCTTPELIGASTFSASSKTLRFEEKSSLTGASRTARRTLLATPSSKIGSQYRGVQ